MDFWKGTLADNGITFSELLIAENSIPSKNIKLVGRIWRFLDVSENLNLSLSYEPSFRKP